MYPHQLINSSTLNMFIRKLYISAILLLLCISAIAAKNDAYSEYIDKYSEMAVEQMQAHGIPASITLAQGLLESAAGRSELARKANNHFGIKCHNTWKGDTVLRDDDEAGECFRSYNDAKESFEDHSQFLKKKRYAPLFALKADDYASWAKTLRACGYATDPNYADRLITIIERYALYAFDNDEDTNAEVTAEFIRATLTNSHTIRRSRSLHYVIATPGDTYRSISREFGIDAEKLAMLNDSDDPDSEIKNWEEVYFEPKHDTAPDDLRTITIGEDESIHSIAQRLGVKQSELMRLNPRTKDHPGSKLRLH